MPYVTVLVIKSQDSLWSKPFHTDLNGNFEVRGLPLSEYKLKLQFMGYQSKTISKIELSAEKSEVNLGAIFMDADSKLLQEIVIEYQKPVLEVQDDKLVYSLEGIAAEGSTASDILKNVPMVSVDMDGKATIAGKTNTRVFIDGKPSDYSSANIGELLSILPADALESIEVITDPSAKFGADGDGIINIVMKKGKKVGLTGNVSSRLGSLGNYNTGAFLSRKKEKFSFNANLGFNHGNRYANGYANRSNIFTDTIFYNKQFDNSDRKSDGLNGRLAMNFLPDTGQTLKLSIRAGGNQANARSLSDNNFFTGEWDPQSTRSQNNKTLTGSSDYAIDLNYDFKAANRMHYSLGFNLNQNSNSNKRNYSRYIYNPDGSLRNLHPDLQLSQNEEIGRNLEFNLDADKAFEFLSLRLETGFKANLNRSDNDQQVQQYNYDLEEFTFNPALTNKFNFDQGIYSGYVSARLKLQKWNVRLGNRTELTTVSFGAGNVQIDPYFSFFPSFALNRSFNNTYRLGFNYSRRIARPRANVLNPLIDDSDPQNIRFGNPNLKPAFTDQYEASFTFLGKGWSVSPRLSYAVSKGVIERIRTSIKTGITETTFQNFGNSESLNLNIFSNYQPAKNKNFNSGFTLSQVSYTSAANPNLNRTGLAIRANAGLTYSFKKQDAIEANLNYLKNTVAQGMEKGSVETQFGYKKNFLKNKMSAKIAVIDPFAQKSSTAITQGPSFYQERFSWQKTRNFMASLSYRFTQITETPVKLKR